MRLPAADRARLKAEGLARIARAPENGARRGLLAECFNNYLELPPADLPQFERLVAEQPAEVMAMVNSFEVSGARKATREIARKLLEKKFGELPPAALERLYALPVERLEEIALAVSDATSLKGLGLADE